MTQNRKNNEIGKTQRQLKSDAIADDTGKPKSEIVEENPRQIALDKLQQLKNKFNDEEKKKDPPQQQFPIAMKQDLKQLRSEIHGIAGHLNTLDIKFQEFEDLLPRITDLYDSQIKELKTSLNVIKEIQEGIIDVLLPEEVETTEVETQGSQSTQTIKAEA